MGIRNLPIERKLINLIEECGEVVQAATKLIRAKNGDTPITEQEAWDHLLEELADTELCSEMITTGKDRIVIRSIKNRKRRRWEERLEQEAEDDRVLPGDCE